LSYYIYPTSLLIASSLQEVEPSKGHILLLSYTPGSSSLTLVEQMEVHGAVYNLCEFQGKLLATVNNKVHLFKWAPAAAGRHELVSDCSPIGVQVLCLFLAVR
jgi:DNA damage-binding protein 1